MDPCCVRCVSQSVCARAIVNVIIARAPSVARGNKGETGRTYDRGAILLPRVKFPVDIVTENLPTKIKKSLFQKNSYSEALNRN